MDTDKFHYRCFQCDAHYGADQVHYLCSSCAAGNRPGQPPMGVLQVVYDYTGLRAPKEVFRQLAASGFIDLLPIASAGSLPPLRVGQSPLYSKNKFREKTLPRTLHIKDDGQNPTFSFKDRASALVSAFAKEQGFETIVVASTGNAGSSMAGICASQQQRAIVMVPAAAPRAKLIQILMYAALIVPVNGSYDDAFDLSLAATAAHGWYNRNTGHNPLTVEGKKTAAFEIFHQTKGRVPGRIFVPVGDGVILSGLYKGFEELMWLGLIERMPELVAVQAAGSPNLVKNLDSPEFKTFAGHSLADSISVDVPRNFYMARHYIHRYEGRAMSVSDQEILEASALLAGETGLFTEPASAAAFAGWLASERDTGPRGLPDEDLVLLTGSGLKDLQAVAGMITLPDPVNPDLDSLNQYLHTNGKNLPT